MKYTLTLLAMAVIGLQTGALAQSYVLDAEKSILNWTGQKVTGKHYGTVALQSGSFEMRDGNFSSGTFRIDMNSILSTDVKNEEMAGKLVGHLKSDDFFGVEQYPVATFLLRESSALKGGNFTIKGDLTIKDVTRPIVFKAIVAEADGAKKLYGNIVVDRTEFDVRYGSGKFFDGLADRTIYDEFTIALDLLAHSE